MRTILASPGFARERRGKPAGVHDLIIVGGGVSGMAAALEARKAGLDLVLFEAKRPFQTVADFPKAKPIYTYPRGMTPAGDLQVTADVKEALLQTAIYAGTPAANTAFQIAVEEQECGRKSG